MIENTTFGNDAMRGLTTDIEMFLLDTELVKI